LGYVLALTQVTDGTIRQGADQGLVPFNNLTEGIPSSIQAFGHQIGIVAFRRVHRFGCHHITLYGTEEGREVTKIHIRRGVG
jgi:hypothetical protein